MSHSNEHKAHANSIGTNASGLSMGDAESLSHFPTPPEETPSISMRLEHGKIYSNSPPVTPSREYSQRSLDSGGSTPRRQPSKPGSVKSHHTSTSTSSSPSRRGFTYNDYGLAPPVPPLAPIRRKHHLTDKTAPRDEWHQGSSRIIVDDAEERMLPTSLITNLLSSTADNLSRNQYPPSHLTNDGMSAISEMTYPPPAGVVRTSLVHANPPYPGSPSKSAKGEHSSNKPPSTFLTLDDDESPIGSTATFDSYGPSVIRTASMTRKLGARGASVVGLASGKIRRVASTSRSPSINMPRGKRSDPDDEPDVQRLIMPNLHVGPSSGPYSPARRSSVGFPPDDPTNGPAQAINQNQNGTSFLSSLVPQFSLEKRQSTPSSKQAVGGWFAQKALPRAPLRQDMSLGDEEAHKQENSLPLPALISPAGELQGMLEKDQHPHHSISSSPTNGGYGLASPTWESKYEDVPGHNTLGDLTSVPRGTPNAWIGHPDNPKAQRAPMTRKQKIIAIVGGSILFIALVLGISLGLVLPNMKHSSPICSAGLTGKACNLNSTCVCTSTLPGQCDALAQNLISLIPTLNELFSANYTPNTLSDAVWEAQGAPPNNQCAFQALLVDVAPALDATTAPNRTAWAQTAMLWNLVQSQDTAAVLAMQNFIVSAPWDNLGQTDGPVNNTSNQFTVSSLGFTYNLAAQIVTELSVTFASNGNPSSAQLAQVGSIPSSTLDRMYSFALASSTQRQQALANWWTGTLGQKSVDLSTFLSLISSSPILLPFDATTSQGNHSLSTLLTNSTSSPFPIPLACYPDLSDIQVELLSAVETTVFGLSPASAVSTFDTSCFANRPIYGVLDILHLRQPFFDSRTGVARQAAVLQTDVTSRAVIYSGEILSALPGIPLTTGLPQPQAVDPRQYGTSNHLSHVLLNFLTSISNVSIAIALVEFVLTSSTVPPLNNTHLYNSLASIPALEVAVFGTVSPSDVSYVVSSFSNPSGDLFFGTDQSLALRDWAINGANSSVSWSQYAVSPEIIRDTSFSSTAFNSVWDPAYEFFRITTTQLVNVGTIVKAFQVTGQFAP